MNLNRTLTFLCLILLGNCELSAQNLPAKTFWLGYLQTARIILKIEDSVNNHKTGEFIFPIYNQSLKIDHITITGDSLKVSLSKFNADYRAKLSADKSKLSGMWEQGGIKIGLTLKKTGDTTLRRPQTPRGPFPYREEKVTYYNNDKSIKYGATLTIPAAAKNAPAVILITGSGQQDRDETLFDHKLFWVIADHLTRNGIAVLRVDDRGIGETKGDVMHATSADFAKDVLVGVDYLKTHPGIDTKHIGLVGHSEGGVIGPLAAVQSKDIAFMVSLAGLGVKGSELLLRQSHDGYKKIGLTDNQILQLDSLTAGMMQLGRQGLTEKDLKPAFGKFFTNWSKSQPDSLLIKTGFKGPNSVDNINAMAERFYMPWTLYLANYDPATTLGRLTIPILALNGKKDKQVSARENLAGFNKLLTKAGNKHFKTMALPGLNHFFQHANTGEVDEYAEIEETISPEVLDIVTKWIQKEARQPKINRRLSYLP